MMRRMGCLACVVGLLGACHAEGSPRVATATTRTPITQPVPGVVKPAIDSETAFRTLERVIAAARLTTLTPPCYVFEDMPGSPAYSFIVREHHTPTCGGDLGTGPRMFSVYYDTAQARVLTDNNNVATGDTLMYVIARDVKPAR